MKNKMIKQRIIKSTLLNVMIPVIILGFFSIMVSYKSAVNYVMQNVGNTAKTAAEMAHWEMKSFQNIAIETGGNRRLTDMSVSNEDKQATMDAITKGYGFENGTVIDAKGNGFDGNTYTDRKYFQEAMNGNACISEPLISKLTGKLSIVVAAPLWKDGIFGGTPAGCVCFVPNVEFLNDITREISVSKNSSAYILNKEGVIIADHNTETVANAVNYIEMAESDSSYANIADVHKKMAALETGQDKIRADGRSTLIGYAPIAESDGWSIAVSAPTSDFLMNTYIAIAVTLLLIIISAVVAINRAQSMGTRIGDPVSKCTERIRKFAEGDLQSPVPTVNTEDETKILADATAVLLANINQIISDMGNMLSVMADGDFTVSSQCPESVYCGDFHVLIDSVREINHRLNAALLQINSSSDQVSSDSDQVSGEAQAVSQNAAEQAAAVEQLVQSIHTIEGKVTETSESCENGKQLVRETAEYISNVTKETHGLTSAMQEINIAAGEIDKIIKTIQDIANQTNLLALNAAIEAARAGEAGKGFAVVAEDVRVLAAKSADAVRDTADLIERMIAAVENGTGITEKTAEAVEGIEGRSVKVEQIVENIAVASTEQTGMIQQITTGIEQISAAITLTSESAEESASASEKLSGQAEMLKNVVSAFQLKS